MSGFHDHGPSPAEAFLKLVDEALAAKIRKQLKDPLMKIAEAEVDAAVDAAVKSLEMELRAYREEQWDRNTIELIVKRQAAG